MIERKPINVTVGATTMRRVLKISVSKVCSLEPAPLISRKPMMIIAIPTVSYTHLDVYKRQVYTLAHVQHRGHITLAAGYHINHLRSKLLWYVDGQLLYLSLIHI